MNLKKLMGRSRISDSENYAKIIIDYLRHRTGFKWNYSLVNHKYPLIQTTYDVWRIDILSFDDYTSVFAFLNLNEIFITNDLSNYANIVRAFYPECKKQYITDDNSFNEFKNEILTRLNKEKIDAENDEKTKLNKEKARVKNEQHKEFLYEFLPIFKKYEKDYQYDTYYYGSHHYSPISVEVEEVTYGYDNVYSYRYAIQTIKDNGKTEIIAIADISETDDENVYKFYFFKPLCGHSTWKVNVNDIEKNIKEILRSV